MAEFKIDDIGYRSGKMDAMSQFHVVRKLAPVLTSFKDLRADTEDMDFGPVAEAIAKLGNDDVEFIIATCLSVVSREQGKGAGWAPAWNPAAKRPMFDDIDMRIMLMIVRKVLEEAVGPFSLALRQ